MMRRTPRKKRPPLVYLHLGQEAPRIGSGVRGVEVVTVGHKWVTVRYWPGGRNGHPIQHKFRKEEFEKLQH